MFSQRTKAVSVVTSPRIQWVFRKDTIQGFWRVLRVCWERGAGPGTGRGYSAKLSFAIERRLFYGIRSEGSTDWIVTVLGVRVHYCRSYGGRFP